MVLGDSSQIKSARFMEICLLKSCNIHKYIIAEHFFFMKPWFQAREIDLFKSKFLF